MFDLMTWIFYTFILMRIFYTFILMRRIFYTFDTPERRDVLSWTSPTTKRFPEARGGSVREISRPEGMYIVHCTLYNQIHSD